MEHWRDTSRVWLSVKPRVQKLGQTNEAVAFLRELIGRFPGVASLHHSLSASLYDVFSRAGKDVPEARDLLDESARHILKAIELAPGEYYHASWASFVLRVKGDNASALRYGKQALGLAPTDEDKIDVPTDNSPHLREERSLCRRTELPSGGYAN